MRRRRDLPGRARWAVRAWHGVRAGVHLRAAGRRRHQLLQRQHGLRLAADELTTHWWAASRQRRRARRRSTSVEVGLVATAVALVLGHAAGVRPEPLLVLRPADAVAAGRAADRAARHRHRAGAADRVPDDPRSIELSIWTVAVAHATFCIVVVYNNVIARLRRMGTHARGGVDGPRRRHLHHVPAGHLPAAARRRCWPARCSRSALSFDEIVVTLFTAPPGVTTLPIWIFQNLFRPNQAPVVNVVAAALVAALDHPDLRQPAAGRRLGGGRQGGDRRGSAPARSAHGRAPPLVDLTDASCRPRREQRTCRTPGCWPRGSPRPSWDMAPVVTAALSTRPSSAATSATRRWTPTPACPRPWPTTRWPSGRGPSSQSTWCWWAT